MKIKKLTQKALEVKAAEMIEKWGEVQMFMTEDGQAFFSKKQASAHAIARGFKCFDVKALADENNKSADVNKDGKTDTDKTEAGNKGKSANADENNEPADVNKDGKTDTDKK